MKKKNDDERYENFIEVFLRNWKNVPGFKEFIKLLFGSLFILILFVLMVGTKNENRSKNEKVVNTSTTTTTTTSVSYLDIINNSLNTKFKVDGSIKTQNNEYSITYEYLNNTITGYLESKTSTYHFKIANNKVYEIKVNDEVENNKIFNEINLDYIIPNNLIFVLKDKDFIKNENIYNYNFDNGNLNVYVNNNKINKIEITDNGATYLLNYN